MTVKSGSGADAQFFKGNIIFLKFSFRMNQLHSDMKTLAIKASNYFQKCYSTINFASILKKVISE